MIKCPNCNSKKIKHYPDGIAERYETAFKGSVYEYG